VVSSFHEVPESAEKGKAEVNKAEEERIDKLEKATVTRKKKRPTTAAWNDIGSSARRGRRCSCSTNSGGHGGTWT